MKRHGSSDSMAGLISVCQTLGEEDSSGYKRSMLMDEDGFQISEKKRRLGADQVKALEKYFELENKLDPERKVKLAQELGLQPRQVAVWFQNRRARWKTKQLERDYGLLKANFDSLKHNYDSLKHDNDSLLKQIGELKSKVYGEDDEESNIPTKEQEREQEQSDEKLGDDEEEEEEATIYKEGSSDSDSSAILNDDGNNNNNVRMGMGMGIGMKGDDGIGGERAYEPEFVKDDEENNNFFSGDESCNFFSDDQAPTLQWYCQDQWNLALMESPPPVSK